MEYESLGPTEFVNMIKTGAPPREYDFYQKTVEILDKIISTAGL